MQRNVSKCEVQAGFAPSGPGDSFENHFVDLTLDRNCDRKVAGLKEAEYRAEVKSHIERPVFLFGIIPAEALREGARMDFVAFIKLASNQ